MEILDISKNRLTDLPFFTRVEHLKELNLDGNPLNHKLVEAYEQGPDAVKAYLCAKVTGKELALIEAYLILVSEGAVVRLV